MLAFLELLASLQRAPVKSKLCLESSRAPTRGWLLAPDS
jgi:hypothetical protein